MSSPASKILERLLSPSSELCLAFNKPMSLYSKDIRLLSILKVESSDFTCTCRDVTGDGFICSMSNLQGGVLARPGLGSSPCYCSLDQCPSSLMAHDVDFLLQTTEGLYVYSALIGSGSFMTLQGRIYVPVYVPLSGIRCSIASVPGHHGSRYIGSVMADVKGFPRVGPPASAELLGKRHIRPYGSTLQNTVTMGGLAQMPFMVIIAPCQVRASNMIMKSISLSGRAMGKNPVCVTTIIGESEESFTDQHQQVRKLQRFWRVWHIFSDSEAADPKQMFAFWDSSRWSFSHQLVKVSYQQVHVYELTCAPARWMEGRDGISAMVPASCQRASILKDTLPADEVSLTIPAFHRTSFGMTVPMPRCSLFRSEASAVSDSTVFLSPALEATHAFIRPVVPAVIRQTSTKSVLDVQAEQLRKVEDCSSDASDFGSDDIHVSSLRLAVAIGSHPGALVPGSRQTDLNLLERSCRVSGKPCVRFSKGDLGSVGALMKQLTGSSSRFILPPHRAGYVEGSTPGDMSAILPEGPSPGGPGCPARRFEGAYSDAGESSPPPDAVLLAMLDSITDSLKTGTPFASRLIDGRARDPSSNEFAVQLRKALNVTKSTMQLTDAERTEFRSAMTSRQAGDLPSSRIISLLKKL